MTNSDFISSTRSDYNTMHYHDKKPGVSVSVAELPDVEQAIRPSMHHQYSGMRRADSDQSGNQAAPGFKTSDDSVNGLGRFYYNFLNFHITTRYMVYVIPVSILLAIPLIIFATVAKHATSHGTRLLGLFVWLEIVWCALWFTKLCAKALPQIFQFCCGIVTSGTRRYAELIRALELPLSVLAWTVVAWASTPVLSAFNHPVPKSQLEWSMWTQTLRKIMLASIPVAGVFCVQKFFLQLIAVNYHRKQFSTRIKETQHMVRLLTELYSASLALFPSYCVEFADEDYLIHNAMVASGIKAGRHQRTQVKLVGGLARVGNGVTSVLNSIVSEVVGGRKLDPNSDKAVVIAALERKVSAEALARRIWQSLTEAGKDAMYEADLVRVLGEERREDAEEIFRTLDKDRNNDVSLDEMQIMLCDMEKSQKDMIRSMHDVKQTVRALDRILEFGCVILGAVIYAAFFSANFLKNITLFTTSIMSFSFAFAGTVQEFAGSVIFLFVKHPYDVGDRVEISGVPMLVEHISLLYTVFLRVDTQHTVQIPNIVNNSNWIENVSRSGAMKEQVKIEVSADTTAEDIETLRTELETFVTHADNKRDFQPQVLVDINAVGNFKSLELRVEFGHKSNWSNEALRLTRRARFMTELVGALRRIPIYAPGCGYAGLGDYHAPSYSVSVSHAEAEAAKAEFDEQKKAKRLSMKKEQERLLAAKAEAEMEAAMRKQSVTSTSWTDSGMSSGVEVHSTEQQEAAMRRHQAEVHAQGEIQAHAIAMRHVQGYEGQLQALAADRRRGSVASLGLRASNATVAGSRLSVEGSRR